jgi:LmbE family N-acetylglucosaminyl deacetylase
MSVILVIASHPDDETLGCGGTLARHIEEGDDVHVICMTNGVSSRGQDLLAIKARQLAMCKAMKSLMVQSYQLLDYPDNKMDSLPLLEIVQCIEILINKIKPNIVYTHFYGDLNIDHQITYRAVMTACRPQPGFSVGEINCFEIPSSTNWEGSNQSIFHPNMFIDITNYWKYKKRALKDYKIEMKSVPHYRSIDSLDILSRMRGYSHGLERAEAFVTVRKIKFKG